MTKIEELRKSIGLSRTEMSRKFGIPLRTLEAWDAEVRHPAPWAEKLILAELSRIAQQEK